MMTIFQKRQQHLALALQQHDLEALLITHAANRYYLSGFELHDPQCNESAGCILVTSQGEAWLLTDSRYRDAAARIWPQDRIFIYAGNKDEHMASWLRDKGIRTLGIEAGSMSVSQYKALGKTLDLIPTKNLVEELRVIKDDTEIQALKNSCALNHKVLAQIESLLEPGMTEASLAWKIEQLFREQGASELSFETIAAVGPNSALPHAIPGTTPISNNCPVLVDTGCRLDSYCSDQTRTFWVGDNPTTVFQETLKHVQEAQRVAIEHYQPGKPIKEADLAARNYFAKHGLDDHFTHSLGHGVGLETHESPAVGPRSQAVFKPGMVVTAEPGLYYPSWGGVRWEHMVVITEQGHEIL
jgi:Xaa-Pro aminopeptidase